jgi:hypothetical protein
VRGGDDCVDGEGPHGGELLALYAVRRSLEPGTPDVAIVSEVVK